MPINVSNEHWYVAVVKIGENNAELNILNNIDMRNENAEEKLMNVATKYCQRMTDQRRRAHAEVNENTPTPMKTTKMSSTMSRKKLIVV